MFCIFVTQKIQIIKIIMLHKDNVGKYKMQF